MPPDTTCVVDSAKPRRDEASSTAVDDVSAAKPCGDSVSARPLPIVRMMRHPPAYVPLPMARPASRVTHHGGAEPWRRCPDVMSSRVMMPIVFCASPVPCASDTIEAEIVRPPRNPLVIASRRPRLVIL
jgi:hypothetical protein